MGKPWTMRETDTLKLAYLSAGDGKLDLKALALQLGRSKWSVAMRASRLGLGNKKRAHLGPDDHEERNRMSERARRRIAEHGHPRGALGLRHSEASKAALSRAAKLAWSKPNSPLRSLVASQRRSDNALAYQLGLRGRPRGFTRSTTGGPRDDLGGLYVRSRWEANYARYLTWLQQTGGIRSWSYEPKTFLFEKIKGGMRSYTPDFEVVRSDGRREWHEVKGWMDQKSRTKLARMGRFFPTEKVVLIDERWFRTAKRQGLPALIPNWEVGK